MIEKNNMHWLDCEKSKALQNLFYAGMSDWDMRRCIGGKVSRSIDYSRTIDVTKEVKEALEQATLKAKFWAANISIPFEGKSMGMDTVGTAQQPKPTGDGADVNDMVMADLIARKQAGTKKYGSPLKTHNGRSALIDAYQECLDLCLYLRQEIEEGNGGT